MLAVLLIDHGRPLEATVIIDRVWGDRPPKHARDVLYTYMSRLRSILAGEPVSLRRANGGYLCEGDPELVDLHQFYRFTARAAEERDPAARLDMLRRATALWRDEEPLQGLTGPWIDGSRQRLRQQWLSAVISRYDLELGHGQHVAMIDELTGLVQRNPTVEPLAGQLMIALHRSGRHCEALDTYQRTRAALIEEQGLEPGSALRELQHAILTGDQALALGPRPASPPGAPPPVPAQLPRPVHGFTGRTAELAALAQATASTGAPPLVIISGMAGVGKTSLAVHFAHQVADRFHDGQVYLNLRGFDATAAPMASGEALRTVLLALGVPGEQLPATLDAQVAFYRSCLAQRMMLLVLDNARDAEQVRPLLPGSADCLVVITSRDPLRSLVVEQGARPVTLGAFTESESWELLRRRIGSRRLAADPRAVSTITTACAGLPLALSIIAARAAVQAHLPLATLVGELERPRAGLDPFAGRDPATDLRHVFSSSYRSLTPPAAAMFRLLSPHPGPHVTVASAASVAGVPGPEARRLLDELSTAGLTHEHVAGRFVTHDLLRTFAAELFTTVDSAETRAAALCRLLDHYLHSAYRASRLRNPHRAMIPLGHVCDDVTLDSPADAARALDWLDAERPTLVAAVQQAGSQGLNTHAWQLAWVIADYLLRHGHWHDQVQAQRAALASARRAGNRDAEARAHNSLARAEQRLGEYKAAERHFHRALQIFEVLGDHAGQAHTRLGLAGLCNEHAGRHAEALEHAFRAQESFRSADDAAGEARALNSAGYSQALLGNHEQTLRHCGTALAILRDLGHREGEAHAWDSLGYAHRHLGNLPAAVRCLRRAVELFDAIGARIDQAHSLAELGEALAAAGRPAAAARAWQGAVDILDALHHPNARTIASKVDNA